jgi:hypothetical protein
VSEIAKSFIFFDIAGAIPLKSTDVSEISACYLRHRTVLFGLFFDSDVGGKIFSAASVDLKRTPGLHMPNDRTLHNLCCENLKLYKRE